MKSLASPHQRLRLGMVGGGLNSGIGPVHRYAAHLDGRFDLVAGAFSPDEDRNRLAATAYGIASDRVYSSFTEMATREAARADGIEAVAIVAPNALHVPASRTFVEHGIAVICDKPLATNLQDALDLERLVSERQSILVLTHSYSGYPMVREARDRVKDGAIGDVRVVHVEHAAPMGVDIGEQQGVKQMVWRTDPKAVGSSAVLADVGVHAHQLARFVTGLEVSEVAAELSTLVAGRESDDNAHVLLRFNSGARGMLWASFVGAGNRQGLQLRVFGSTGSLHWAQEQPDQLVIRPQNAPHFTLRRGEAWLGDAAKQSTRTKAGQPEGILEAFANIYSDAAELIRASQERRPPAFPATLCPSVHDGVLGMAFIAACDASSRQRGAWTSLSV